MSEIEVVDGIVEQVPSYKEWFIPCFDSSGTGECFWAGAMTDDRQEAEAAARGCLGAKRSFVLRVWLPCREGEKQ